MPVVQTKNENIVLKLSGRLYFSEEMDGVVAALRNVLRRRDSPKLIIVAGGGATARTYITAASKMGADEATLDELGIRVSRLNALVTMSALGSLAVGFAPTSLDEIVEAFEATRSDKRAIVVGGLHPGQSTNAVGALIAEKLRAGRFINATDVDGVYDKDPKKFPDAKKLKTVTTKVLAKILDRESMKAGGYELMDPIALKLIERSRIQTWIVKCDGKTIEDTLLKRRMSGTRIVF